MPQERIGLFRFGLGCCFAHKKMKIEKLIRIKLLIMNNLSSLYVIIYYKFVEPFKWGEVLVKNEPSSIFLEIEG